MPTISQEPTTREMINLKYLITDIGHVVKRKGKAIEGLGCVDLNGNSKDYIGGVTEDDDTIIGNVVWTDNCLISSDGRVFSCKAGERYMGETGFLWFKQLPLIG